MLAPSPRDMQACVENCHFEKITVDVAYNLFSFFFNITIKVKRKKIEKKERKREKKKG